MMQSRKDNGRAGPHGFTLIELLVVIAILALLLALLTPSLQQGRELARLAACAGNLRTIGTAVQQYAFQWETFLGPNGYLPDGQRVVWLQKHDVPFDASRCPATPAIIPNPGPSASPIRNTTRSRTYCINAYVRSHQVHGSYFGVGFGLGPYVRTPEGGLYGDFMRKPPGRVTNGDMIIASDHATPGRGYDGMFIRPFSTSALADDGSVNVSNWTLGFYHLGEKFTWADGGTGVKEGFNQSVHWDGRVEKRRVQEMYDDWYGPDHIGYYSKQHPSPYWTGYP